jgi:hypothetical protein
MNKICLIVMYNHNFEANIDRIEKLYKDKFNDIFHLIPFYTGDKENVIKVYGSAYQFNEYFIQGANKFVNDKFSHYVFVADDIIMNPEFSQDNIIEKLNLDANSGFIYNCRPMAYETLFCWDWSYSSIRHMFFNKSGCEYQKFVPSLQDAQKRFEKHGLPSKNMTQKGLEKIQKFFVKDLYDYYRYDFSFLYKKGIGSFLSKFFLAVLRKLGFYPFNNTKKTSMTFRKLVKTSGYKYIAEQLRKEDKDDYIYPLACGYSDFFVIPHKNINEFLHLSSVFASIRVFVEVSVPTAMALTLDKIVTSKDIGCLPNFVSEEFAQQHEYSIKNLEENWDKSTLFCHPIKLSKWKESYE